MRPVYTRSSTITQINKDRWNNQILLKKKKKRNTSHTWNWACDLLVFPLLCEYEESSTHRTNVNVRLNKTIKFSEPNQLNEMIKCAKIYIRKLKCISIWWNRIKTNRRAVKHSLRGEFSARYRVILLCDLLRFFFSYSLATGYFSFRFKFYSELNCINKRSSVKNVSEVAKFHKRIEKNKLKFHFFFLNLCKFFAFFSLQFKLIINGDKWWN